MASASGVLMAVLIASAVQSARKRAPTSSSPRKVTRAARRRISNWRTPRRSSGWRARTSRRGSEAGGSNSLSSFTRSLGTADSLRRTVERTKCTGGAAARRPLSSYFAAARGGAPPPVEHVFVILLENENAGSTFGSESSAPYLARTLPGQGLLGRPGLLYPSSVKTLAD